MREYMTNLGTVLMMVAVAEILIPEGNTKKFASLAMGFMVITAVVFPLDSVLTMPEFDAQSFVEEEKSAESIRAQYHAEGLKRQAESLASGINEKIKHSSKVSVQMANDGTLAGVTINLKGDESEAVSYIVNTLGLSRERIKLNYDKD